MNKTMNEIITTKPPRPNKSIRRPNNTRDTRNRPDRSMDREESRNCVRARQSASHHRIDFTKPFDGSDVSFQVGGKKVHAVSAVLRMASQELAELMRKQGSRVDLGDAAIEHTDFCQLMAMLHPVAGTIQRINDKNIYRLLPLIRLFGMSALQNECEEYLLNLPPELRHLGLAAEYNFEHLEKDVLNWAATNAYCILEADPDWGLVNMDQRRVILEKIVRRYEEREEKTQSKTNNSKETTEVTNGATKEHPNGKNNRDDDHLDKVLQDNDRLRKEREKLAVRNKELQQKCERYKGITQKVSDIVQGKPNVSTLPVCCSVAKEKHYSGTEDKCSTCRNYMVGQIKQLLSKTSL